MSIFWCLSVSQTQFVISGNPKQIQQQQQMQQIQQQQKFQQQQQQLLQQQQQQQQMQQQRNQQFQDQRLMQQQMANKPGNMPPNMPQSNFNPMGRPQNPQSQGNYTTASNQVRFITVPSDKYLDWTKLKDFTDYKLNFDKMVIFIFDRVENIVGKGDCFFCETLIFP